MSNDIKLLSDHLEPNPRRRHGAQNGRLVPCSVSKRHGHYPAGESCPHCEPAPAENATFFGDELITLGQRYYEWRSSFNCTIADSWNELDAVEQLRWQHEAEAAIMTAGGYLPPWV